MKRSFLSFIAGVITVITFGIPLVAGAMSYGGYSQIPSYYNPWMQGSQHIFAPYTYVNNTPYTNVAASASSYAYPYTYPNQQQMYGYSYPQYQTSYTQPNYSNYYQNYGYSSYPSYTSSYMSGDQYCYSGYGCYPFYVADPHQWVYDYWTGTWY